MKHLLLFFTALLLLHSCDNDDSNENPRSLPPITETGANTFGCYIDDLLFLPRDGDGSFGSEDKALIFWGGGTDNEYNEIDVHDFQSEKTASILIHLQGLYQRGDGDYIIDESNGFNGIDGLDQNYIHCRVWREDVGNYQSYLSYENSGVVRITKYNFNSGIISGTFNGNVRNYQVPHDTIQIHQGRFDLNGYTLPDAEFE